MTTLKLREYQLGAIMAVMDAWASGVQCPAVVLPTGMGKTVIFSEIVTRLVRDGRRPLVLVHRDELAEQAENKLRDADPSMSVGVVKAERNEIGSDVTIGSVQTLSRTPRLHALSREQFTDIIVDECHHAAAVSYVKILKWFGALDYQDWRDDRAWACGKNTPEWPRAVGFTATMERADGKALGTVWSDVVYRKDIMYGILNGYLVDVSGIAVTVDGLDLASVARSKGDYQDGALGNALESAGAGEAIARAYREHCSIPCTCSDCQHGRIAYRQALLFAPTVATAESFAQALNDEGVSAEVITGTTSKEERALIYKRYRAHEIDVICSCMVLTEGFDMPQAEVAIIARPTSSAALYVQMVGRVLRPSPLTGKTSALVLDVVGVSSRLALASIPVLTAGAVVPAEGESIVQAAQRQQQESLGRVALEGELSHVVVDLFHRSTSAWLTTRGGVWFIPTRECLIFLWPDGTGKFKVARTGTPYTCKGGSYLYDRRAFALEYAMAWAEQAAEEIDPSVASKKSSWRRKSNQPSDAQLAQCRQYRIAVPDGATKSQVSDLLSVHFASRALDRGGKRS
jgi:superfamily II DNA or RNA helicase